MSLRAEINDFFYDENKNIIRYDKPISESITGDRPITPFAINPIPLNSEILINCCKFTDNDNLEYTKNNVNIKSNLDGTWDCNGRTINDLNDLQQIWRSINHRELLVDLTNIKEYIY